METLFFAYQQCHSLLSLEMCVSLLYAFAPPTGDKDDAPERQRYPDSPARKRKPHNATRFAIQKAGLGVYTGTAMREWVQLTEVNATRLKWTSSGFRRICRMKQKGKGSVSCSTHMPNKRVRLT